ncbi:MAG: hypothetical protein ACRD1L_10460 [Terriglobales bacterium]
MQATQATDPAYAAGYNAAYGLGQQDQEAGVAANAHKFRAYQEGSQGYTDQYGTMEAYKASFQSGFDDGYRDGFAGRPRSVPEAAAAATPPSSGPAPTPGAATPAATTLAASELSADDAKAARGNGYREGYNIGQSDANSNAVYNATASREYQMATVGYVPSMGPNDAYQSGFRKGFSTGYDDGFNHRLYNSGIGARQSPVVEAPGAAPAGEHDLPTDPTTLKTMASGVYDNGVLLAQGTQIQTTLNQPINTKNSYAGEAFSLAVTVPVWVGAVAAIPAGSTIQGTVKQVQRGGKLRGHAEIQLQYNTITIPGQTPVPLNATATAVGDAAKSVNTTEGTVNGQGSGAGKKAGTDAAVGSVLGGIFGGYGGLIRGAIAGAAIGTAGAMISHSKDITLREGEALQLRLEAPLALPKEQP